MWSVRPEKEDKGRGIRPTHGLRAPRNRVGMKSYREATDDLNVLLSGAPHSGKKGADGGRPTESAI